MAKFDILIKGEDAYYPNIEANDEEEAKEIASEWYVERELKIEVIK